MIALIDNLASASGAGFAVSWHGSMVAPAQLVIATRVVVVLKIVVVGAFTVVVYTRL